MTCCLMMMTTEAMPAVLIPRTVQTETQPPKSISPLFAHSGSSFVCVVIVAVHQHLLPLLRERCAACWSICGRTCGLHLRIGRESTQVCQRGGAYSRHLYASMHKHDAIQLELRMVSLPTAIGATQTSFDRSGRSLATFTTQCEKRRRDNLPLSQDDMRNCTRKLDTYLVSDISPVVIGVQQKMTYYVTKHLVPHVGCALQYARLLNFL